MKTLWMKFSQDFEAFSLWISEKEKQLEVLKSSSLPLEEQISSVKAVSAELQAQRGVSSQLEGGSQALSQFVSSGEGSRIKARLTQIGRYWEELQESVQQLEEALQESATYLQRFTCSLQQMKLSVCLCPPPDEALSVSLPRPPDEALNEALSVSLPPPDEALSVSLPPPQMKLSMKLSVCLCPTPQMNLSMKLSVCLPPQMKLSVGLPPPPDEALSVSLPPPQMKLSVCLCPPPQMKLSVCLCPPPDEALSVSLPPPDEALNEALSVSLPPPPDEALSVSLPPPDEALNEALSVSAPPDEALNEALSVSLPPPDEALSVSLPPPDEALSVSLPPPPDEALNEALSVSLPPPDEALSVSLPPPQMKLSVCLCPPQMKLSVCLPPPQMKLSVCLCPPQMKLSMKLSVCLCPPPDEALSVSLPPPQMKLSVCLCPPPDEALSVSLPPPPDEALSVSLPPPDEALSVSLPPPDEALSVSLPPTDEALNEALSVSLPPPPDEALSVSLPPPDEALSVSLPPPDEALSVSLPPTDEALSVSLSPPPQMKLSVCLCPPPDEALSVSLSPQMKLSMKLSVCLCPPPPDEALSVSLSPQMKLSVCLCPPPQMKLSMDSSLSDLQKQLHLPLKSCSSSSETYRALQDHMEVCVTAGGVCVTAGGVCEEVLQQQEALRGGLLSLQASARRLRERPAAERSVTELNVRYEESLQEARDSQRGLEELLTLWRRFEKQRSHLTSCLERSEAASHPESRLLSADRAKLRAEIQELQGVHEELLSLQTPLSELQTLGQSLSVSASVEREQQLQGEIQSLQRRLQEQREYLPQRVSALQTHLSLLDQFDQDLLLFSSRSETLLCKLHSAPAVNIRDLQPTHTHCKGGGEGGEAQLLRSRAAGGLQPQLDALQTAELQTESLQRLHSFLQKHSHAGGVLRGLRETLEGRGVLRESLEGGGVLKETLEGGGSWDRGRVEDLQREMTSIGSDILQLETLAVNLDSSLCKSHLHLGGSEGGVSRVSSCRLLADAVSSQLDSVRSLLGEKQSEAEALGSLWSSFRRRRETLLQTVEKLEEQAERSSCREATLSQLQNRLRFFSQLEDELQSHLHELQWLQERGGELALRDQELGGEVQREISLLQNTWGETRTLITERY
ncbi:hypothetical protein JOQ06_000784 [Pogonophryne albipinna]|uniref:KASH domain-containing protein n=1 Tax=Pogonophryne albipinna TaxID=1090488 RepID=A0AAD6AA21_9TELE|nr:hypothetical protein JOQ06_000784 [Pogonophryne albipinna]